MITYQSSTDSYFNPRSLAGATDCSCLLIFRRIHFNPRSLAGATQRQRNYHHQRRYFNPRSLAGATLMLAVVLVILKFQSTLPYGSDVFIKRQLHIFCISIHAPLRERRAGPAWHNRYYRFQSTLPYGSDSVLSILEPPFIIFQSTLPCGSDSRIWSSSKGMPAISIHVPLRERQGSKLHAKRGQTFQSTLPCGSDVEIVFVCGVEAEFQSTLPYGSDEF